MILIAILIVALLCVKFLAFRAYLFSNMLILTLAFIIIGAICLASGLPEGSGLVFVALVACLVVDAIFLVFTLRGIEESKRREYAKNFFMYGFWLVARVFLISLIITIPLLKFIIDKPAEYRDIIVSDGWGAGLGHKVHVRDLGNGTYEDAYGNRYKDND